MARLTAAAAAAAVRVVKLQVCAVARPCAEALAAPGVTVAEYCSDAPSGAAGENVAVLLVTSYETLPATAAEPCVTVNVAVVRVAAFIAMLKVALTGELLHTSAAAFAGLVAMTSGEAPSATVENVHEWSAASGTPATSLLPAVTVAV